MGNLDSEILGIIIWVGYNWEIYMKLEETNESAIEIFDLQVSSGPKILTGEYTNCNK